MPEEKVVPRQAVNGAHVGRIQGERLFPLRDGVLEAPLLAEIPGLLVVSPGDGGIEGEGMRKLTWCVIEEVASGDWGMGGNPVTTADVKAIRAGVPA